MGWGVETKRIVLLGMTSVIMMIAIAPLLAAMSSPLGQRLLILPIYHPSPTNSEACRSPTQTPHPHTCSHTTCFTPRRKMDSLWVARRSTGLSHLHTTSFSISIHHLTPELHRWQSTPRRPQPSPVPFLSTPPEAEKTVLQLKQSFPIPFVHPSRSSSSHSHSPCSHRLYPPTPPIHPSPHSLVSSSVGMPAGALSPLSDFITDIVAGVLYDGFSLCEAGNM